jgi:hypothetical protein
MTAHILTQAEADKFNLGRNTNWYQMAKAGMECEVIGHFKRIKIMEQVVEVRIDDGPVDGTHPTGAEPTVGKTVAPNPTGPVLHIAGLSPVQSPVPPVAPVVSPVARPPVAPAVALPSALSAAASIGRTATDLNDVLQAAAPQGANHQ